MLEQMEHFYKNIHGWFNFANIYSDMIRRFPDGSHFVEVGSWYGKSAVYMGVEIINSGKKIRFDCVDSWTNKGDNWDYEKAFDVFLKHIEPIKDTVNYHRLPSEEASGLYDDESLDFVFIDAAHDYDNVINDITLWYPKVKTGGVVAGHDYPWPGVEKAVNEFFTDFVIDGESWIHYIDNG
jgi:cephalosporin hydroxylase